MVVIQNYYSLVKEEDLSLHNFEEKEAYQNQ
jgi:hypothetical protein